MTVMVQIVDDNFEPTCTDGIQELSADTIALLWNYLKRCFDPEGVIDVH
jgi:hypothetical protein